MTAARSAWLFRARLGHRRVALPVVAVIATAIAASGEIGLEVQAVLLALGVAFLGLPHGALDHWVGRAVFGPRFGRAWPLPFLAFYLGLASVVLVGWALVPGVTLAGFLILSVLHFGLGDLEDGAAGWQAAAEALARGGLPVALSILFHPEEVGLLFGWLVGDGPAVLAGLDAARLPLAIAWGTVAALAVASLARRSAGDAAARLDLAETALLVAVFAVCPPLLAFGLYFCLLHSPRHLLDMAAAAEPASPERAWARLMAAALPLTLATLGLAVLGYLLLPDGGTGTANLLKVVFWGLSALTVPHMALTALETRSPFARLREA